MAGDNTPCHLSRRVQHVFDKDPVAGIRVIYKDMGDGADEFAILDDGTAAHALDDASGDLQQFRVRVPQ